MNWSYITSKLKHAIDRVEGKETKQKMSFSWMEKEPFDSLVSQLALKDDIYHSFPLEISLVLCLCVALESGFGSTFMPSNPAIPLPSRGYFLRLKWGL